MPGLRNIFTHNRIWSVGLYVSDTDFSFDKTLRSPRFVLDSKTLRKAKGHLHTYADPFLFVNADELFLFYETQAVGQNGRIEAVRTRDLKTFESLGVVFDPEFHVSYPFVFKTRDTVYLVPESLAANEVALYEFRRFPFKLTKTRTLLRGQYRDSSLIYLDGKWFLFTTSDLGLEIFFSNDLENGSFIAHPQNPVTTDPRYFRCGGSIISIGNDLFRIAQDCSGEYGRNINILKIDRMAANEYEEQVVVNDYLTGTETWNRYGGHHLSVARFKGQTVVATDGRQNDIVANKLMALFFR
jgi:hypothetical protein